MRVTKFYLAFKAWHFVVLVTTVLTWPTLSPAGGIYYEFGGGPALLVGSQPLFGDPAPNNPRVGAGLNLLLGKNFARDQGSFFQFHGAIKQWMMMASDDLVSMSTLLTYFMMRLEMPRMYVGLGVAPAIFRKLDTEQVSGSYAFSSGSFSGMGEIGLLWRVVHFFHIALEGSAHMVRNAQGLGPKPAMVAGIQFRIYLTNDKETKRNVSDFDGWRYPFGLEIFSKD